jgi:SulP family sulfate permease
MPMINSLSLRHWRGDVFGGVTAAIVALPLPWPLGSLRGRGRSQASTALFSRGFSRLSLAVPPPKSLAPPGR